MAVFTVVADGQENNATTWVKDVDNYASFLRLGTMYGNTYNVGARFTGVTVPQGATINTATVTFESKYVNAGYVIGIYAEATDSAAAFNGSSRRPSQLTPTTASHTVTTGIAASSTGQTLPFTAPLQEIVDRTGWVSGGHVALLLLNEGSGTQNYFWLRNLEFTGGGQDMTLTVDFTEGGGATSRVPRPIVASRAVQRASLF